jgi:ribonuclease HI
MILIFTDGSSRGNPGPGGFGVIVNVNKRVTELGGFDKHTTNNRMEMLAIVEALRFVASHNEPITLYTDSKYTIDGVTKWVSGWKKNGWKTKNKTDVLNRDLWEQLVPLVEGKSITWHHVAGHAGIPGNERVDQIANGLSGGLDIPLYDGLEKDYSVSLDITARGEASKKGGTSGPAYSYLAYIDGQLYRYTTWAECEKNVKGKNAKFRKALSQSHEKEIMKEWGILGS